MRVPRRLIALAIAVLAVALPATAHAANRVPQCFGTTTAVSPGGERTWSLRCEDADTTPRPLAATVVNQPTHGEVSVIGGTKVRYLPHPGFDGDDSFTFRASDGADQSSIVTQQIEVTSANLAPICVAYDVEAVNGFVDLGQPCYDPNEGDAVLPELVTFPLHGVVRFVQNVYRVQYDAASGYRGDDSFTLRASDGTTTGAPAEIDVESVDLAPPECDTPAPMPARWGLSKTLRLACRQNSPDPPSSFAYNFEIVDPPDHGTYNLSAFEKVYRPDDGYTGPDEMTVRASRAGGEAGPPVTLAFLVSEDANEPPSCPAAGPVRVRTASSQFAPAGCTDPDRDELTTTLDPAPVHGRLREALFTADDGYAGADSFVLHADDGRASSSVTQTIQIIGDGGNRLPACAPIARRLLRNATTGFSPSCPDDDADPVTLEWTAPGHGTLTAGTNGTMVYDPDQDFVGSDEFTFTASDGFGETVPMTVRVEVVAPTAPECPTPPTANVRTNKDRGFLIWCVSEEQPVFPTVIDGPDHGDLEGFGPGQWNYVPDQDYQGPDSFTIRASNAAGDRDVTQEIVVSDAANTPPTCSPHARAVTREQPIELLLGCSDEEDDPLTVSVVAGPDHGTVGAWDPGTQRATYTPTAGFVGVDEFTFKANDGDGDSPVVRQRVRVAPADENARPLCASVGTTAPPDTDQAVHLSCYDGDGDPLTFAIADHPDYGTATDPNSAGTFTYHSDPGFEGVDRIRVTANDGTETSPEATVEIRVGTDFGAGFPLCTSLAGNVDHNTSRRLRLRCAHPILPGALPVEVEEPAHGDLVAESGGWWRYTPDPGFSGVDTFTYTGVLDPPITQQPAVVEMHVRSGPPAEGGQTDEPAPPPIVEQTPPPPPLPPPLGQTPPAGDPARDLAARRLGGTVIEAKGLELGDARAFMRPGTTVKVDAATEKLLAIVCPTACEVSASQQLEFAATARAAAKRRVRLKPQRLKLAAGRPGVVVLRLTKAQRKRLRRARRATLRVTVSVKPAGRKAVRDSIKVRLRA